MTARARPGETAAEIAARYGCSVAPEAVTKCPPNAFAIDESKTLPARNSREYKAMVARIVARNRRMAALLDSERRAQELPAAPSPTAYPARGTALIAAADVRDRKDSADRIAKSCGAGRPSVARKAGNQGMSARAGAKAPAREKPGGARRSAATEARKAKMAATEARKAKMAATAAQDERWLELVRAGATRRDACLAIGIRIGGGPAVEARLRARGVDVPKASSDAGLVKRKAKARENIERLLALVKGGMTIAGAGRHMGVSQSSSDNYARILREQGRLGPVRKGRRKGDRARPGEIAAAKARSERKERRMLEFLAAYETGLSVRNAARSIGVSDSMGCNYARLWRERGVELERWRMTATEKAT